MLDNKNLYSSNSAENEKKDVRQKIQTHNHAALDAHLGELLTQIEKLDWKQQPLILVEDLWINETKSDPDNVVGLVSKMGGFTFDPHFGELIIHIYDMKKWVLSSYEFAILETDDKITISGDILSSSDVQGNGFGSWLLVHNADFLRTFLKSHYANSEKKIYATIRDGAKVNTARLNLDEVSQLDRKNWTTSISENATGYVSDSKTLLKYTGSTVGRICVFQDLDEGIKLG